VRQKVLKKALLDANVLVAVITDKINVAAKLREAEIEPFVSKSVLNEIKTMGGSLAGAIEKYLKTQGITLVESKKAKADDDLLCLSQDGFSIVTLDAGLKRRLKKANAQIITLKRDGRRVLI
jgi:rRNA-processing protein FCF1